MSKPSTSNKELNLKFDNITISGGIGVGTTTLFNNLQSYLKPLGWKFKSSGQIVRDYTKENILPIATLVSDEFDKKIEGKVRETLLNKKHYVIEGWLAGFIVRDLKNILKVLVMCSDDSIRIDRVANRDKLTVKKAKEYIKLRKEKNFKKWKKIYGNYDFFNPKFYDLVIDTYSSGQLETTGKVLDKLGYRIRK